MIIIRFSYSQLSQKKVVIMLYDSLTSPQPIFKCTKSSTKRKSIKLQGHTYVKLFSFKGNRNNFVRMGKLGNTTGHYRSQPYVSNKMCTLIFHIIFYCLPFRSTWVHRRLTRSLVLCVMFCRSLFVLLPIVFWPLRCPSFFDLRILITPLVSSNSSYYRPIYCCMSIFCFRYFKHTLTLY